MPDKAKYWFPTRTYGWGWGVPTVWQGWLVYGIAVVLFIVGPFLFSVRDQPWLFQAYIWCVALLLVAICWLKGEPPRWRWGK